MKRADMEALDNPDKVNRYVDFLLLDDGSAVATANDGWPLLCTGASWATIAERMDEAVPSFTSDDAQSCRGSIRFTITATGWLCLPPTIMKLTGLNSISPNGPKAEEVLLSAPWYLVGLLLLSRFLI